MLFSGFALALRRRATLPQLDLGAAADKPEIPIAPEPSRLVTRTIQDGVLSSILLGTNLKRTTEAAAV